MIKLLSCRMNIGHYRSKPFTFVNQFTDENGRVIVIEAKVDDVIFALINIDNPKLEAEQHHTISDLSRLPQNVVKE